MPNTTKTQTKIANEVGLVNIGALRRRALLRVWDGEKVTRREKHRLRSHGLAEEEENGSIRLTNAGRWTAVACILDIHTTELFIAADMYAAYCMWKERGTTGTYPIEWATAKLGMFLEPRTLYNKIARLRRTGMIDKVAPGLYTITHMGANRLAPYHEDMYALRAHVHRVT